MEQQSKWPGRWLIGMLHRCAAQEPEWGMAIMAEQDSVPAGPPRVGWALGGLWFLLRRRIFGRRAGLAQRLAAALGMAWSALWLYAFAASLFDDAPDVPWPEALRSVVGEAAILIAFAVACWRPGAALVAAVPILAGYSVVVWTTAAANDGLPVIAVGIFIGFPVLIFGLITASAGGRSAEGRSERPTTR